MCCTLPISNWWNSFLHIFASHFTSILIRRFFHTLLRPLQLSTVMQYDVHSVSHIYQMLTTKIYSDSAPSIRSTSQPAKASIAHTANLCHLLHSTSLIMNAHSLFLHLSSAWTKLSSCRFCLFFVSHLSLFFFALVINNLKAASNHTTATPAWNVEWTVKMFQHINSGIMYTQSVWERVAFRKCCYRRKIKSEKFMMFSSLLLLRRGLSLIDKLFV